MKPHVFLTFLALLFPCALGMRQRDMTTQIPQTFLRLHFPTCEDLEIGNADDVANRFLVHAFTEKVFSDSFVSFAGEFSTSCLDGTFTTVALGDLARTTVLLLAADFQQETQEAIVNYFNSNADEDYSNFVAEETGLTPLDAQVDALITSSPSMSMAPSNAPSRAPSSTPTASPSLRPSGSPSSHPSSVPSLLPSGFPSAQPSVSHAPTSSPMPSMSPSSAPSISPTISQEPSIAPSSAPTALTVVQYLPTRFVFTLPTSCVETDPTVVQGIVDAFVVDLLSTKTNRENFVNFQGRYEVSCEDVASSQWTTSATGDVILTSDTDPESSQPLLDTTLNAYYQFTGKEDFEGFLVATGLAPDDVQVFALATPPTAAPSGDDDDINLAIAVGIPLGIVALMAIVGIFVYARKLSDDDDIVTVPPPPPSNPPPVSPGKSTSNAASSAPTKIAASTRRSEKETPAPVPIVEAQHDEDNMSTISDVMTVNTSQAAAYQPV